MNYVEIADYNWAEGSLMQRADKRLKKGYATFALASQMKKRVQRAAGVPHYILWQNHNEINLCHHR